jgi:chorismate mutase / prephenate dehydratase
MKKNFLSKKLDAVEKKIYAFVRERAKLIEEFFREKSRGSSDANFTDFVMTHLDRKLWDGLCPDEKHLMQLLCTEMDSYLLKKNSRLRVSFLGPEATFTHQAAKKYFGNSVIMSPEKSIADIFQEVEKGNSDFGVAPVENSVEGAVSHTLDLFISSQVQIYSEVLLPITQNLVSMSPIEKIKYVYSHPNVFGQCKNWLRNNLPQAELIETSSTSEAVKIIKRTKNAAAIGSLMSSEIHGVNVIADSIQDESGNTTRFLVISKKKSKKGRRNKTSVVYLIKDKPGALFESLLPFRKQGVNLVKIESRPSKMRAWEYYFFVDMEGYVTDKKVRLSLDELQKNCVFLKILGSYPAAG